MYAYVDESNKKVDPFGLINWKGFSSVKDANGETGLQRHFNKHVIRQKEFGDITQNQYLKKAKEFGKQIQRKLYWSQFK